MGISYVEQGMFEIFRAGLATKAIPTAQLPAASVDLDGAIIVEKTATTANVIVYSVDTAGNPLRIRISGTEF